MLAATLQRAVGSMRKLWWMLIASMVLVLLYARMASAQESDIAATRPLTIAGILGLGTPTGVAGIEVQHSFRTSYVALSAGLGLGPGLQVAAMPRFRFAFDQTAHTSSAIVVGVGGSYGSVTRPLICIMHCGPEETWQIGWGNIEVGLEVRTTAGFVIKPFIGIAFVVDATRTACGTPSGSPCVGRPALEADRLPFLGVTLGRAM